MPVLLFLIDTSASMNQRTHLGTTYLDIAKGAVETFMKLRSRDPASRGDRYMLVSFEEAPYGIKEKCVWLIIYLYKYIVDFYFGRNPFFLEPSVIVTITDGNKLTSTTGVQEELHLPLNTPLPGSELTKEPFRWDQRLFALVLRIPGHVAVEPEPVAGVPQDESAITPMCEVTGGRSYSVCSQRMLNQCLESLVQKIHSGVVINFEKTGPDPPPVEDCDINLLRVLLRKFMQSFHSEGEVLHFFLPLLGHWPIPEAFWPDQNSPTLPPRTSHPQVRFSCVDSEPMVIDKLPFDKYELEPSPLTQYILERKSPHICWQVFVCNSAKYSDLGQPFGYLKASTALSCVNLFVMPYNFPVLLPLLDDLFKVHKLKPILKWQQSFENYLKTMPPYYIGPLKKALRMMGAPNLIADNMEYGLSYSVVSYLKKLSQQTKLESERVILSVGKKAPQDCGVKVRSRGNTLSLAQRRDFTQILQGITGEAPLCPLELNPKQFTGFHISVLNKDFKPQSFRNPYDIPRRHLLDQLTRMRRNLLKAARCWLRGQDEDQLHSIPIAQMGNYQDFLKHSPSPLREADPDQPKRLHTFGNPFKLDKKGMMIDEADEFVTGPQNRTKRPGDPSLQGAPKRRRCMSPLLRPGRLPAPSVVSNNVGAKAPPSPPSPAPPLPLPPPPPPPISLAKAMPVILKAPETNHRVLTDNDVFGNHMGNQYIPERAPVPDAGLNSDGSPFQSKAAPVNHVGDVEDGHSSPSELSEGSEEGEPSTEDTMSSSSPSQLKRLRQSQSQELNTQLRVLITREIRKPGRRYERIFYFLKQVQGSFNTRLIYLQNVIKEASRFKKRVLIEQLEGFLEEIHMRSNQMNHMDGFSNSA
ncbi:INT6 protein, partial [Amia calva]|nr:INT6 protein [Amia calva]